MSLVVRPGEITSEPLSETIRIFGSDHTMHPGWWRLGTIRVYPQWLRTWAKMARALEDRLLRQEAEMEHLKESLACYRRQYPVPDAKP